MNEGKLSINHACAIGAAFLGGISVAAIAAAFLFTRNPAIVWLGLMFVSLVFICVALFVAFLRRKLVLFSDSLCRTIDNMLDGTAPPPQIYEEENLLFKINHRLARLYEVLRENRESIAKERADLQELISDISHQAKTPIQVFKGIVVYAAFSYPIWMMIAFAAILLVFCWFIPLLFVNRMMKKTTVERLRQN